MATNGTSPTTYYLDYEDKFTLTLILFIFYATLYLPSAILFFLRRNYHPIKLRGYELTLFHTFIPLLELIIRFFEDDACVVKNIRGYLIIPLWIFPYFFRTLNLWYCYNYHALMSKRGTLLLSSTDSDSADAHPPLEGFKERVLDFLHDHPFFLSLRFAATVLGISFVFFAGSAALMTYVAGVDPLTCDALYSFPFFAISIVVAISLVILFLVLLRGVNDPYLIKHEMSILLVLGIFIAPAWAASFMMHLGIWDQFFLELIVISTSLVSLLYPLIGSYYYSKWLRLASSGRKKTDPEKDTNSIEIEFWATLEHPVLAVAFEQFTIECWSSENLLFHRMVVKFKELPESEREALVKEIFENFIVNESKCQINVDSDLRQSLLEGHQKNIISEDMFNEADEHCLTLLKYSVFPLWKESSKLKESLKKLKMKSIQDYIAVRESLELDQLGSRSHAVLEVKLS